MRRLYVSKLHGQQDHISFLAQTALDRIDELDQADRAVVSDVVDAIGEEQFKEL